MTRFYSQRAAGRSPPRFKSFDSTIVAEAHQHDTSTEQAFDFTHLRPYDEIDLNFPHCIWGWGFSGAFPPTMTPFDAPERR